MLLLVPLVAALNTNPSGGGWWSIGSWLGCGRDGCKDRNERPDLEGEAPVKQARSPVEDDELLLRVEEVRRPGAAGLMRAEEARRPGAAGLMRAEEVGPQGARQDDEVLMRTEELPRRERGRVPEPAAGVDEVETDAVRGPFGLDLVRTGVPRGWFWMDEGDWEAGDGAVQGGFEFFVRHVEHELAQAHPEVLVGRTPFHLTAKTLQLLAQPAMRVALAGRTVVLAAMEIRSRLPKSYHTLAGHAEEQHAQLEAFDRTQRGVRDSARVGDPIGVKTGMGHANALILRFPEDANEKIKAFHYDTIVEDRVASEVRAQHRAYTLVLPEPWVKHQADHESCSAFTMAWIFAMVGRELDNMAHPGQNDRTATYTLPLRMAAFAQQTDARNQIRRANAAAEKPRGSEGRSVTGQNALRRALAEEVLRPAAAQDACCLCWDHRAAQAVHVRTVDEIAEWSSADQACHNACYTAGSKRQPYSYALRFGCDDPALLAVSTGDGTGAGSLSGSGAGRGREHRAPPAAVLQDYTDSPQDVVDAVQPPVPDEEALEPLVRTRP